MTMGNIAFMPAVEALKEQDLKQKIALTGVSGSGKTYTALTLARELAKLKPGGAGKVCVADQENNAALKYAKIFDFDHAPISAPYTPENLARIMAAAFEAGYYILIVDGLSQMWGGEGGMMELVDDAAARSKSGNSYIAWGGKNRKIWNGFLRSIIECPVHLICTMRSKQAHEISVDSNGKKCVDKLGLAPVMRNGIEFEFDVVGDISLDHTLAIQTTRCIPLDEKVYAKPDCVELATELHGWLSSDEAQNLWATGEQMAELRYLVDNSGVELVIEKTAKLLKGQRVKTATWEKAMAWARKEIAKVGGNDGIEQKQAPAEREPGQEG